MKRTLSNYFDIFYKITLSQTKFFLLYGIIAEKVY